MNKPLAFNIFLIILSIYVTSDPEEITHLMKFDKDLILWSKPLSISTGNETLYIGDGC